MTTKDGRLVVLSFMPEFIKIDYDSAFGNKTEVEWLIFDPSDPEGLAARATEIDLATGLFGPKPPRPDFRMFPNLQAVLLANGGYENLTADMIPDGCTVANTFEHEHSMADWVIMSMIMLSRNTIGIDRAFRNHTLRSFQEMGGPSLDMSQATLGVVGLGHIDSRLVQLARAHNVRCLVAMRTPISDQEAAEQGIDHVYPMDSFHEMLSECDFVVPAVPLSESTRGMFGEAEYAVMKDSAYIINIARGEVLDEESTYLALKNDVIAGAAIDAWWAEDGAAWPQTILSDGSGPSNRSGSWTTY
jgi:phosphoglycerate dehydrogenase-like enzyme